MNSEIDCMINKRILETQIFLNACCFRPDEICNQFSTNPNSDEKKSFRIPKD